jgi:hypothetical protein
MPNEHSRKGTDDKIFEMHGTISALSENIKQLRDEMSKVPMCTAEIVRLKDKVQALEKAMTKVQQEQKVIEMASVFFRAAKWIAGLIIACGGAWAVLSNHP